MSTATTNGFLLIRTEGDSCDSSVQFSCLRFRYPRKINTHTTFTPSSAVIQQDDNTWYIGAETVLAPPASGTWLTDADLKFTLPPNGTITAIEATVSFASPWGPTSNNCPQPNEALGVLIVDGKRFPIIQKLNSSSAAGSREIATFIHYDIPTKYSQGVGVLHVKANPFGCWSDCEIQGIMRIEF